MCMNTSGFDMFHPFYLSSTTRRPSFRVHRLHRRRLLKQTKDKVREGLLKRAMEIDNLKLYMENKSMIEENEKLRKKALLLHHENRVLQSQLKNAANFSQPQQ